MYATKMKLHYSAPPMKPPYVSTVTTVSTTPTNSLPNTTVSLFITQLLNNTLSAIFVRYYQLLLT
jgi:hypothetical protein